MQDARKQSHRLYNGKRLWLYNVHLKLSMTGGANGYSGPRIVSKGGSCPRCPIVPAPILHV
jgi:hypothetical protein